MMDVRIVGATMIHFDRHSMAWHRSMACYLLRLRPAGAAMPAASSLDTCARRPALIKGDATPRPLHVPATRSCKNEIISR